LASIGAGHSWPKLRLWGEGERVVVLSKADPPGTIGSVRFLQDALGFVPTTQFEETIDALFLRVHGMLAGEDESTFQTLLGVLREERDDDEVSTWRRFEAINGYDPDEAPEDLIEGAIQLANRYSRQDAEEAVAANPGNESIAVVGSLIEEARGIRATAVDFSDAVSAAGQFDLSAKLEPWILAEKTALRVRDAIGAGNKPLLNKRLGELISVAPQVFQKHSTSNAEIPYGLRIRSGSTSERVLLHARWGQGRRFELMRALGDAIWTENSELGPVSGAGTGRQKFQRAFAATILCPSSALTAYLGDAEPSDDDIAAAAGYFHVSERMVRSVLVNKHIMDRIRINDSIEMPSTDSGIEELTDAA
jgi:hypothetical protein